jgi:hypothetical protein
MFGVAVQLRSTKVLRGNSAVPLQNRWPDVGCREEHYRVVAGGFATSVVNTLRYT